MAVAYSVASSTFTCSVATESMVFIAFIVTVVVMGCYSSVVDVASIYSS